MDKNIESSHMWRFVSHKLPNSKTFILSFGVLVLAAIAFSMTAPRIDAAGNPPTLSLPYASGTTGVSMGIAGLHGGNFSGVTGYPAYSLSGASSVTNASLDIGWVNQSSTTNRTIALASGTVLIGAGNTCNMFLMQTDQNPNLWIEYIHQSNIPSNLTPGAHVNAGDVIGTPTTQYLCGESGDTTFVHTHFAFLQKTGTYTATYIPMADANNNTTLCGANVLTNAVAPGSPTIDNLQGLRSPFTIPACPGTPASLSVTNGVNITQNPLVVGQQIGGQLSANFTVSDTVSGTTFTLSQVDLVATGPNGVSMDLGAQNVSSIPYGSPYTYSVTVRNFGATHPDAIAGNWTFTPRYLANGVWTNLNGVVGTGIDERGAVGVGISTNGAGVNPDGASAVFRHESNNTVSINWQEGRGGAWYGWHTVASSPVGLTTNAYVMHNELGELLITALGTDGNIYATWENGAGNLRSWVNWVAVDAGPTFAGNAVGLQQYNGLWDLYARGTNGNIYHDYKNPSGPDSGWILVSSSGQQSFVSDPAVTINSLGELQVYAIGSDQQAYTVWQQSSGNQSTWGSWGLQDTSGTQFTGNLAAAIQDNGLIDVYGRTISGTILHDYQTGSVWSGWTPLSTSGQQTFISDPVIDLNISDGYQVYAVGSDHNVYSSWQQTPNNNNSFSAWTLTMGYTTTAFASSMLGAFSLSNGPMDVYAQGTDNNVYDFYQYPDQGSIWWRPAGSAAYIVPFHNSDGSTELIADDTAGIISAGYESAPGNGLTWKPLNVEGTIFPTKPAVVLNPSGGVQLFVVDGGGYMDSVWENTANSWNSWSGWNTNWSRTTQFAGNAVVVRQSNGYGDAYGRTTANTILHNYQDGTGAWSGWVAVSTSGQQIFAGDPSLVVNQPGGWQIWARDPNGYVYSAWQQTNNNNTSWTQWSLLDNSGTQLASGPIVISQPNGYMDVQGLTTSGQILHDYQAPAWSGWTPISTSGQQTFSSAPSIVYNVNTEEQDFAIGSDTLIYSSWETSSGANNAWSSWVQGPPGGGASQISTLRMSSNMMDLFAIGTDGIIYENYQHSDQSWSGWIGL